MHSIIIPYRDRERHLEILLPRLQEKFRDKDYEILIVEQDDTENFKLAQLFNVGALNANGTKLVFHDVDHYPGDDVSYEISESPVYPIRKVLFLTESGERRPMWDIPAGYRKFSKSADGHWGGVFILTKNMFEKIGGFNPMYSGWGKEDNDRHQRLLLAGYNPIRRIDGTFYGLYHKDNCPLPNDEDFIKNHKILDEMKQYLHIGYKNMTYDFTEFVVGNNKNLRWLKIKNITIVGV
jgi:hypothetical protein